MACRSKEAAEQCLLARRLRTLSPGKRVLAVRFALAMGEVVQRTGWLFLFTSESARHAVGLMSGQLFRLSHAESGHKSFWFRHIPPYCLCANCCAKRTPHLLHRNATRCTEMHFVAQKCISLHRKPHVAQKCSNDSLTTDAQERQ